MTGIPTFDSPHHLALTVRDRAASAQWYREVLGFRFVREFETGIPRILQVHVESGFFISLYDHPDRSGDHFDPRRTGLDHLALAVPSDGRLSEWIDHLDTIGIEHSSVHDLGHARFISLEDPDGIQIELWYQILPFHPADDPRSDRA
jgi:catechol 2,3-dioxygenase-like lactoylglutathione lyase family enzyme